MTIDLTTCKICGKGPFKNYAGLSKHLYQMHREVTNKDYYDAYIKQPDEGLCVLCGRPTQFSGRLNRGYYTHCSQKCTANDKKVVDQRKATNLELHGSEGYNNHEQTSATKLAKYGDANYANGDQIRATKLERYGIAGFNNPEKRKLTKLKLYGATNFVNSEKAARTKQEKYGSATFNNPQKAQDTKLERYGAANFVNADKARDTVTANTIKKYSALTSSHTRIISYVHPNFHCECLKCGKEFDIQISTGFYRIFRFDIPWCTHCTPAEPSRSKQEHSVFNYISSIVGEDKVQHSVRTLIPNTELDIYIPSLKLAVEFNGLYWHNELKKTSMYHLRKSLACDKAGIRLIQVFEDEWNFRQDVVKDNLALLLGKYRRISCHDCAVRRVGKEDSDSFLEKHHLLGPCDSVWTGGLYFGDMLVAVMTISMGDGGAYTLSRYCAETGVVVAGGAAKLFDRFTRDFPGVNTVSGSADRRWSSNINFYNTMGFELVGATRPEYSYVVNGIRRNRMEFTKKRLVEAGFPPEKSEHEIMLSRKIYRIYDCGNWKYVWRR